MNIVKIPRTMKTNLVEADGSTEEAAKFVRDFNSLANEADESLAKYKALEFEIERLLRTVVSQDIISIVQNPTIVKTSDLQTELEPYKDMQQKIKWLQAQLGDLKGKGKDTPCVSDTLDPLSQKLENENVELEFQVFNYAKENALLETSYKNMFDSINLRAQLYDKVSEQKDITKGTSANTKFANQSTLGKQFLQPLRNHFVVRQPNAFQSERQKRVPLKVTETNDLLNPVTSNSVPITTKANFVENDKVITPEMFRINPSKTSRVDNVMSNKPVKASVRIKPVTNSQPHVISQENVNSNSKGTVRFENDHVATILGYGNLQWGNILITRVYFVEGLGYNLFLVGQFYDSDLEAARTMLIVSCAPLLLWAKAISTACYTQNCPIIHCRFEKTPYELINSRKQDNSFLHVFGALCYPKNDREAIGKLGVKAMAFEQRSSKLGLQSMNSGQITMYDDYIGDQPSATPSTAPAASAPQVLQTPMTSTTTEDVYVCQDEGFIDVDHPIHAYKLKKALYGLKQAPRACRFEMLMMGEMMFFLGLQVNQSPRGIFINQSNYVLEILKKYEMETCNPIGTPMEIKDKLDLDQNGTLVDATKYRSMIGALMYLTSSRPDIVHATCLCARYQAKPIEKHHKENSGFELTKFSDADYAWCKDSFKSISSEAQFLGEKLVSWSSKKQDCMVLSIVKVEYVSLSA
ncbi:retrovirus-related pol polyprotein from transposon TNT 1-94 [Tanacetum coccineum]